MNDDKLKELEVICAPYTEGYWYDVKCLITAYRELLAALKPVMAMIERQETVSPFDVDYHNLCGCVAKHKGE